MNPTLSRTTLVGIVTLLTTAAFGQELLTNSGFETGDTTGWTLNNPAQASAGVITLAARTGNYGFFTAPSIGQTVDLSQTVTTGAGNYRVSFWALGFNNSFTSNDQFLATWNGATLQDLIPADQAWHQYSFIVAGGNGATVLDFTVNGDREGGMNLDDVSVQAVPEPASVGLIGLGALVLIRKGRRS